MTRIAGGLTATLLFLAVPITIAGAQGRKGEVLRLPPAPGRGQLAGVAPAPQQPVRRGYDSDGDGYRRRGHDDGYDGYGYSREGRRAPVVMGVPVVVTSDGRVFADFGRGYEQVLRSCAAQYGSQTSSTPQAYGTQQYTTPTYTVPDYSAQQRLPYNPPVPAQQTESERMAAQSTQGSGGYATQDSPVCWTADAQGRIVVVQP